MSTYRADTAEAVSDAKKWASESATRTLDAYIDMVERARSVGAHAKFAGSGGAIVGTYEDDAMFERLVKVFQEADIAVFKPRIEP